jgi:hypothetical protein
MSRHRQCRHRITVDMPVDQAFMCFTPAGEALWVDGWAPRYVHPADGRTEAGMVFSTGTGDEITHWLLADFDRAARRSRYVRCTPASRMTVVEVQCRELDATRTAVEVSYSLTALNEAGEAAIATFERGFIAMIDGWGAAIAAKRDTLLAAEIR